MIFATNSTQKNDFMALRWVADRRARPCVTVTKARSDHDATRTTWHAFQQGLYAHGLGEMLRLARGRLIPAIDALLAPPFRHVENDTFVGKGTKAFL